MHGVGYPFFAEAMKVFGFAPCITVAEQVEYTLTVSSVLVYSSRLTMVKHTAAKGDSFCLSLTLVIHA